MMFTDVLSRFADVTEEADGGYLALCPAHGDSRPSLRIWRGDDGKVRLSCRAGCRNEDVVKAAGLVWGDLFNANGPGATVPRQRPALVGSGPTAALAQYVDRAAALLHDPASQVGAQALAYAARRFGVDQELAEELRLGADAGFGTTPPYPQEGIRNVPFFPYRARAFTRYPRLAVPLLDFKGVARGLQGRDLSGQCPGRWVSLRNPEGQRWAPYGVFRGQGGYGVTIVSEGPGDGLTAVAVGYDAVVIRGAALAGSPELVEELAAGLKGTQVIAAGDNDAAGQRFNARLADGLRAYGITVYALGIPQAGDDLSDWRDRDPHAFPAALHDAVGGARPVRQEAETAGRKASADVADRTGADFVSREEGMDALKVLEHLTRQFGEAHAIHAYALVAWTDGRIKYADGLGYFLWTGKVWEQSATKVRQEIHRMGAALALAGATSAAKQFLSTSSIDALMTELRSVPAVHVDASAFDARPELLTFNNGTVDLRTGTLRAHDKADMVTRSLSLDFDPDAKAERWERFLEEIFPDRPELPGYVQRLCGYGISGHVSEQCFAVLWGAGANGKSVFTDTLSTVFAPITKTTPFATFEDRNGGGIPNDIAALRGARLVMASEGEKDRAMNEAVLKRITGKDKVTARFLRQEFFTYSPTYLILLATNHRPKFKGQDEGLWRRVKLIPFTRWFAPHERDFDLSDALLRESQGIAAWAVRGAAEWFRNGLQEPPVITRATQEYQATSDALAGFFPGVLEAAPESERIQGDAAYSAYRDWCEDEGLQPKEVWTRRTFYSAMEERGAQRKRDRRGIVLAGIRLAATDTPEGPGIFAK
ncbi:phage/plasmid primase, P4 family [Streptomyces sp. NPDC059063]|uniref:phage/plasmid primase, P4 family n=1 Tax=Streptomyces sp. NPDC059063 TaxID=3346712 RepID=UPI0036A91D09